MSFWHSFFLAGSVAVGAGCAMETADPAGGSPDTGSTTPDASATTRDGGATSRDAGAPMHDADAGSTTDAGAPAPELLDAIDGDHAIAGSWDVSSPIGGDRTLGVVASELFVEEAVSAAGVPGSLEGAARDALAVAVGERLAELVDARAPAELAPGSALMTELGALAARVRYESTLSLSVDGDGGGLDGVETFDRVYVVHDGRTFDFPVESASDAGVVLETTWAGSVREATLDVDPHVIELRYGLLVLWLADSVLAVDVAAIADRTTAALACEPIVDALLAGRASLSVDVGLTTLRIERETLLDACAEAFGSIEAYALGLFSLDTPLEIGGTVDVDVTAAGSLTLRSGPDHGGHVLVGPRALSPPVHATFAGTAL